MIMALDETTRWIIGTVIAILGVAGTFVGAKYIRQNRQSQNADNGGTAVLGRKNAAGRDQGVTRYSAENQSAQTINNHNYFIGMSELQSQTMAEKADRQSELLEEKIYSKLDTRGEKIDQEVLNDIDFQITVRDAKISCAKNDSEELKNRLADLILDRSKHKSNTRQAHVLNKAISISYKLTDEEISMVVIMFIFGHISIKGLPIDQLIEKLKSYLKHYAQRYPTNHYCVEYLKLENCVQQRVMMSDFWNIFMKSFSGSLSFGFSPEEYIDSLGGFVPNPTTNGLLSETIVSGKLEWRFFADSKAALENLIPETWPDTARAGALQLFEAKLMPLDQVKSKVLREIPDLRRIDDNWVSSGASASFLLPLGMAIAYSAIGGTSGMDAPLEVWVQ